MTHVNRGQGIPRSCYPIKIIVLAGIKSRDVWSGSFELVGSRCSGYRRDWYNIVLKVKSTRRIFHEMHQQHNVQCFKP